jgi:hypothetical protein
LQQVPPAGGQSSLSSLNFDSDASEVDFAEKCGSRTCLRQNVTNLSHFQLTPWKLGLGKPQVKISPAPSAVPAQGSEAEDPGHEMEDRNLI